MAKPTILSFTQMKNEGPFILEWVAWQRLLGIDQIVVLSNGCDDGTDAILDQLDRMGVLRHLPNPVEVMPGDGDKPQTAGFKYGRLLREWRDADYILLTDVDEFPCLRAGDADLKALLARLDHPDVLTMTEAVFAAGSVVEYRDAPLTGQFTRATQLAPGKWRARRGVKSLTRNDPRLLIRNHRPRVQPKHADSIRWLDGSGRDIPIELRTGLQKGCDCRGTYEFVALHHYPLRSLESFLVKVARGQPMGETIDSEYFRKRNRGDEENTGLLPHQPRLEAEIAALKRDPALADLHVAAVEAHRAKIAKLRRTALFDDIMRIAGVATNDA